MFLLFLLTFFIGRIMHLHFLQCKLCICMHLHIIRLLKCVNAKDRIVLRLGPLFYSILISIPSWWLISASVSMVTLCFPCSTRLMCWRQKMRLIFTDRPHAMLNLFYYDKLHSCYIFLLYRFGLMNFFAGSNYRYF